MNLIFRLFWHLLAAVFQQRIPILGESAIEGRVMPNDLDLNIHVNNGRYFTLADISRLVFFIRTGMLRHAYKNGWRPMLGAVHGSFRKPLGLFQRYRLTTRIIGWEERWCFMEHRFETKEGIAAVVIAMGAFVGRKGLAPASQVMKSLGLEEESPSLPDWIHQWREKQDGLKETYFTPQKSRI